jgi:hypothetical protein
VIARLWRGWVRTEDRDAYAAYVEETGVSEYRRTAGNRGAHILLRDLPDGRTEIIAISFWTSYDAIRGFAGEDVDTAVYYPDDDRYLVQREDRVTHYEVRPEG